MQLADAIAGWLDSRDERERPATLEQLVASIDASPLSATSVENITAAEFAALAQQSDDPDAALDHLEEMAAWAEAEGHVDASGADTPGEDGDADAPVDLDADAEVDAFDRVSPWHVWAAVLSAGLVAVLAVIFVNRPIPEVEEAVVFDPTPPSALTASTDGVLVAHESGNANVIGTGDAVDPTGLTPWWPVFTAGPDGRARQVATAGERLAWTLGNGNALLFDTAAAEGERTTVLWDGSGDRVDAVDIALGESWATTVFGNGTVEAWNLAGPLDEFGSRVWDGDISPRAVEVAVAGDVIVFRLANGNVRTWDPSLPEGRRGVLVWDAVNSPAATALAGADGVFAAVLNNGNIRAWSLGDDGVTNTELAWFGEGEAPDAVAVDASPERLAFVLDNGNAWSWEIGAPEGERRSMMWLGEGSRADATIVGTRDDLATIVLDNGNVRTWDPSLPEGERGALIARTVQTDSLVTAAAIVD